MCSFSMGMPQGLPLLELLSFPTTQRQCVVRASMTVQNHMNRVPYVEGYSDLWIICMHIFRLQQLVILQSDWFIGSFYIT